LFLAFFWLWIGCYKDIGDVENGMGEASSKFESWLDRHEDQPTHSLSTLEVQCMNQNIDLVESQMLIWLHASSFNPAAARITLQAMNGLRG
jgi:hypothetical protein